MLYKSDKRLLLIQHNLNDIVHCALEGGADLNEYVTRDDGAVFAYLGDGGDADAGFFGEFFLFSYPGRSEV